MLTPAIRHCGRARPSGSHSRAQARPHTPGRGRPRGRPETHASTHRRANRSLRRSGIGLGRGDQVSGSGTGARQVS